MTWNDGLEGPAIEIAGSTESPLRVMAGPGTGKSFALMRRVTRLLEDGVDPGKILVCTFTRTAANDLREDILALDVEGADQIRAGTLHSFCFSLLSRADVFELTGRGARPLLAAEARFLLQDLVGINGEGVRDLRKRLRAFEAAWSRLQSEEPGWPNAEEDRLFAGALDGWLRASGSMLIGELVPLALRFLRDNPAHPAFPSFEHVLVDEYQDLNRAEQTLLDIVAQSGSMVIVGDEDQSIYSFRHAHPEGIVDFAQAHPSTVDVPLEECRRCPVRIVDMSNALIRNNLSRADRQLTPRPDNPDGEVVVVQWDDLEDEASGVGEFVAQRIREGRVEPGSVLVLAPRRQIGYAIRDEILSRGIPAHSYFREQPLDGDPTNLEHCEAQAAVSLLVLLANPEDVPALRCWTGYGHGKLAARGWTEISRVCREIEETPRQVLANVAAGELKVPYLSHVLERYLLLENLIDGLDGLSGGELIDSVFPPEAEWAAQLRELAEQAEDDCDAQTLCDLVVRGISQPEVPADVDYVRVMSLHKSKGLTADLVVVGGLVEGLVPTIEDSGGAETAARALEEQRRLFYVALTRARSELILSSAVRMPLALGYKMGARFSQRDAGVGTTIASRFIAETGPECPAAVPGESVLA